MASKRDTSKQKRARQNRAQRAALEARRSKANEPQRPSRSAPVAKGSARTTSSGDATSEPKGFFARTRGQRGPRPGDVPVDIEALEGGWFTKRVQVPGGRQVLTGAILTLVVTVMTVFAKFVPEGGEAGDPATESVFDLYGPWAFVALALPCAIYGAATQFTISPQRRRVWIGGSFVITLVALSGVAFVVYLFPAGFLVYAVWRANRVEGPARRGRTEEPAAADPDGTGDA